ncbi:MAG: hypothetical protein GC180_13130 [Bacteroidetes bacterium]|nr:hypothetical protein [Bacteroidota bacterium]
MDRSEQIAFFNRLKEAMPNDSLAQELSEILKLSLDSIYRRFRGESALTYGELLHIQEALNLKQSILFPTEHIEEVNFIYARPAYGNDMKIFLQEIADQMSLAHRKEELNVSLASDDLPFFMHFLTPELLNFKLHVFSNTPIVPDSHEQEGSSEMQQLFSTILVRWLEASSDEVWGSAPLDSTLKQVEYCVANKLISKNHAAALFREMDTLIEIINEWTRTGKKTAGPIGGGPIRIYHSELNVGEMNLMLRFGEEYSVYKSNYGYGYLRTEHPLFCQETNNWIQEMENKSILITGSGEKYRVRYIDMLKNSVRQSAQKIGLDVALTR